MYCTCLTCSSAGYIPQLFTHCLPIIICVMWIIAMYMISTFVFLLYMLLNLNVLWLFCLCLPWSPFIRYFRFRGILLAFPSFVCIWWYVTYTSLWSFFTIIFCGSFFVCLVFAVVVIFTHLHCCSPFAYAWDTNKEFHKKRRKNWLYYHW